MNTMIKAMIENGYLTTGNKIPMPKTKAATFISDEQSALMTSNYSKILGTPDNPYYYIESDDINDEFKGLDQYDKITGKPIVNELQEILRYKGIIWESTK
jgi:hypothetical protein